MACRLPSRLPLTPKSGADAYLSRHAVQHLHITDAGALDLRDVLALSSGELDWLAYEELDLTLRDPG